MSNTIKTYKDLKYYSTDSFTGIPKFIFRTGKFHVDELPEEIVEIYQRQLKENSGYELFYFDDNDCQKFVEDYCSVELIESYNSLIPKAFKADFWRYAVLYHFGGLYFDFSMQTLIPLDEIIKHSQEIYVRDVADVYGIYNAFIATKAKTDFLAEALSSICNNVRCKRRGSSPLDITGPTFLGNLLKNKLKIDFIPLGYLSNGFYLYYNKDRYYVEDENGLKIIKIKHTNHYLWLYGEMCADVNVDPFPNLHYSKLWEQGKVYK